ncbi:exopolysaccharide biosynthesis protein [Phyllobacterium sp. 21LDTY02-6]|uniref:exopolysaccharide biosynthesis protein n=1 Tax=unclassified Phyllobacterium TaxID=2638441 RepID=UPI00202105B9|nr:MULTISPECIES: exopolysaccharide biosynthesis protein [unclassified Phyllobacterium]MCO4316082.1 exopolysaccharide biosynthesis protein [Phyllobacterium sp. 21LDTY02-6]MCX8279495.1 exopolysaccharide biosynthesis protein [Phyllobacterium sp. 0TCS1.6C]MCX8292314.1 exopolysaccharide biosynthesis protein [Phyllobacterium sp. 0TCS1.6A]
MTATDAGDDLMSEDKKTDAMADNDPRPLSQVFQDLSLSATRPVSFTELEDAFTDRSFAALLTFFAILNLIPLPPGTGMITGIPLVLVSVQMVMGRDSVWLPAFLRTKSISPDRFRQMSDKVVPRLQWLERFIKPRNWPFGRRQGDRWLGAFTTILGMSVVLPMPLSNWLPAFATAIIGIALCERDGRLLFGGLVIGVVSIAIVAGFAFIAASVLTYLASFWPF